MFDPQNLQRLVLLKTGQRKVKSDTEACNIKMRVVSTDIQSLERLILLKHQLQRATGLRTSIVRKRSLQNIQELKRAVLPKRLDQLAEMIFFLEINHPHGHMRWSLILCNRIENEGAAIVEAVLINMQMQAACTVYRHRVHEHSHILTCQTTLIKSKHTKIPGPITSQISSNSINSLAVDSRPTKSQLLKSPVEQHLSCD